MQTHGIVKGEKKRNIWIHPERRQRRPLPRRALEPLVDDRGNATWPQLYVGRTKLKDAHGKRLSMWGLFANTVIKKGQIVPYYGRFISKTQWANNTDNTYVARTNDKKTIVDGTPTHDPALVATGSRGTGKVVAIGKKGLAVASYINESAKGTCMEMHEMGGGDGWVYFVASRSINPCEELLVHYGDEYVRDYVI